MFLALALGWTSLPALASTVTPDQVRQELQQFVRERLPQNIEQVVVEELSLREDRSYDGDGVGLRFRPRPGEDFIGRTVLVMDVLQDSDVLDTRNISFTVRGAVPVRTLATSVSRGESVTETILTTDLRDLSTLPHDALFAADAVDGSYAAARNLTAGTVLCRSMVRRVPYLKRGAAVLVEIRTGPMVVSCTAELQADAYVGEQAKARCNETGTVVSGWMEEGGRLVMALPAVSTPIAAQGGTP